MGPKQLLVFMFKKEKKILFAYFFDVRIFAVIPSTTRMDDSHQHRAQRHNHTTTHPPQVTAGSVWLITALTRVNGMNAPQLGSFNFLPQCIYLYVH